MKKLFFLAGCSALVLSSCSNEIDETGEIPLVNGAAEIRINTYAPGLTRTTLQQVNGNDVARNGFNLYAQSNDEVLINSTVAKIEDEWVAAVLDNKVWKATGETWVWPTNPGQQVKFYAMYSDGATTEFTQDQTWKISKFNGQKDILAAYTEATYGDTNGSGVVNLKFNHILSYLNILLKVPTEDGIQGYGITSIDYSGVNEATYYFEDNNLEPTVEKETTEQGEVDKLVNFHIAPVGEGETITGMTDFMEYYYGYDLFVIPFEDYKINITYNITFSDGSTKSGLTATITSESIEGGLTFEAGNSYLLKIVLPSPTQNNIKLAVEVEPWSETTQNIPESNEAIEPEEPTGAAQMR